MIRGLLVRYSGSIKSCNRKESAPTLGPRREANRLGGAAHGVYSSDGRHYLVKPRRRTKSAAAHRWEELLPRFPAQHIIHSVAGLPDGLYLLETSHCVDIDDVPLFLSSCSNKVPGVGGSTQRRGDALVATNFAHAHNAREGEAK